MPLPFEDQRYRALLKLATTRFGSLNDAEGRVLQVSASADNSEPEDTGQRPEVRAGLLRWLVTDNDAAEHIDPVGIRVHNVTVSDDVHFAFCKVLSPVRFWYCTLKGTFYLQYSELPFLDIENCVLDSGLYAEGLRIPGDVQLLYSTVKGTVFLNFAQIGGNLACGGTISTPSNGITLEASGLKAGMFYSDSDSRREAQLTS